MKKVFLDDLPRWGKGGKTKEGSIRWAKAIGLKILFVYDDMKGEFKVVKYESKDQQLTVDYLGKEYEVKTSHFLKNKIGKIIGKKTKDFRVEIGQRFKDENRDLVILDRKYKPRVASKIGEKEYLKDEKFYKYKCNDCGWDEGWIEENCLTVREHSCSCCKNLVAVLGINTIWDTDRFLVDLGISEGDAKSNVKRSSKKIKIKCPDCEKEKSIVIDDVYRRKSIACTCGDGFSKGHKYIHELLSQLKLDFVDNYRPSWCEYYNEYKKKNSYGEYDFIIESMNLIIEVDGNFHRKDNTMSNQSREVSEYIDGIKDQLAKENGYKLIRIPYEEGDLRINILNSKLNDICELSNINWTKCAEFALGNLIKKVCDYWNLKNTSETTADVGKVFGLNRCTIRDYLNRGAKLGWCVYDTDEEYNKRISKSKETNKMRRSKKIEVLKDNISLGTFDGCNELARRSDELFGVKLIASSISNVANGKRTNHKGFVFRYIGN